MSDYIKCPRCELNYIHKDQQYCEICKAELGLGPELVFAVESEKEETFKLCPICKQVNIKEDEEMCEKCRENRDFKTDQIDYDNDEGWKNYVNDDIADEEEEETEEEISLSKLAEEEALLDDDFKDEEEEEDMYENEDFEYVDPDDPTLLDDEDEDEDEDFDDFDDEK